MLSFSEIHNEQKAKWSHLKYSIDKQLSYEKFDLKFKCLIPVEPRTTVLAAREKLDSVYFEFKRDSNKKWVSLLLLAKKRGGFLIEQGDLYEFLKHNYEKNNPQNRLDLIWDKGEYPDLKINKNINSDSDELWIIGMVDIIKTFSPLIEEYEKKYNLKH